MFAKSPIAFEFHFQNSNLEIMSRFVLAALLAACLVSTMVDAQNQKFPATLADAKAACDKLPATASEQAKKICGAFSKMDEAKYQELKKKIEAAQAAKAGGKWFITMATTFVLLSCAIVFKQHLARRSIVK